jgi:hypothetical protein
MGQGSARLFNFISLFFLLLAVIVLVFVVVKMAGPVLARPTPVISVATPAVLPTATTTNTATNTPLPTWTETPTPTSSATTTNVPTLTPSNTLPPSDTPPPSATLTLTFTPSITPSLEPSLTITNTLQPSQTPVITDTLVPTVGSNFTAQPTEPPPSPFPFDWKDGQVIYTTNFANTAGCAWQGIGGQVFDLNDQPLGQIRIHVFGSGVDTYAVSGSNTLYGISGWEIPVSNAVLANSYLVELQTSQGTIISPQVQVTFTADCSRNLALVNFKQTRPF